MLIKRFLCAFILVTNGFDFNEVLYIVENVWNVLER